jgi:hypothetical protein
MSNYEKRRSIGPGYYKKKQKMIKKLELKFNEAGVSGV